MKRKEFLKSVLGTTGAVAVGKHLPKLEELTPATDNDHILQVINKIPSLEEAMEMLKKNGELPFDYFVRWKIVDEEPRSLCL